MERDELAKHESVGRSSRLGVWGTAINALRKIRISITSMKYFLNAIRKNKYKKILLVVTHLIAEMKKSIDM